MAARRASGLAISRAGGALALAINDNGRGASDRAQPGMGLANMRERAESLPPGRFELDSRTGEGTRIALIFHRRSGQYIA